MLPDRTEPTGGRGDVKQQTINIKHFDVIYITAIQNINLYH